MIISINLSHLLILLFICSLKICRSSNISPRCFWDWQVLISVLLMVRGKELLLSAFLEKNLFLCLLFLGQDWIAFSNEKPNYLPFVNHNTGHLAKFLCQEHGKKESVICKNFQVNRTLSGKSFMYSKNISGPSTDLWGTPDFTSYQVEVWPLRTTLW